MFVRKRTYRIVKDALTLSERVIGQKDKTIARLLSDLSLREDDLRRTRGRLQKALEKTDDEPPDLTYTIAYSF